MVGLVHGANSSRALYCGALDSPAGARGARRRSLDPLYTNVTARTLTKFIESMVGVNWWGPL